MNLNTGNLNGLPQFPAGLGGTGPMNMWQNALMQQRMRPEKPSEAALPVASRPAPTMSVMPQAGWQGPQGGMGLADILDGPQFGSGGGVAPAPGTPPVAGLPQKPQQNFDALGQNLMSQILGPQP